ncbi:hypothetical protein [Aureibacter tunicatorum]|uniref:Uncharacterized protein n=1 Tax=Aureibacter tunicatorum TaxID=866807 RepID=A0AAE3XTT1_9BACT|nr:hypothetical protein [Aureibacter tunicatorum]MDR6241549.1 hypothetical protein [Aureibacter tunicatorum]BDD07227.1 hypothetical protein AUTU_47100 [Aureibacter tunicatorum]
MSDRNLFSLAFAIFFTLTFLSCISLRLPFIYYPLDYGATGFLTLFLLTSWLCFGLVYVNLPVLNWIYKKFELEVNPIIFYPFTTVFILQFLTLAIGYLESSFMLSTGGDWMYLYKGISNSLVFILTGNITAIVTSAIYGYNNKKLKLQY